MEAARVASPETLNLLQRLEEAQQSHWSLINKARDDITTLTAQLGVIQRDIATYGSQIQAVLAKFDAFRQPNYTLYGLLIAMFSILVPGFGVFVTFYTSSSLAPIRTEITKIDSDLQATKAMVDRAAVSANARDQEINKLTQTATTNVSSLQTLTSQVSRISELALGSVQADTNSSTDRRQINDRLKAQEDRLAEEQASRRSAEAANRIQLGEIETQFHAVSNTENLRWAWQNRLNSILFNRTHPGENWPADNFYPPTIFQGQGGSPSLTNGSPGR